MNRSRTISATIRYFDLFFCANLLHTAFAVPGYYSRTQIPWLYA
jgi:hypothetical protein